MTNFLQSSCLNLLWIAEKWGRGFENKVLRRVVIVAKDSARAVVMKGGSKYR